MPKEIAQLAGRQHGILTRAQLLAGERGDAWIHRQVRRGVLVRAHHGVYAVGYRRLDPPARAMAAVLACGPGALLSHESAAALWGWRRWPLDPEVTTAGDRRPRGIRAHRCTTLAPADHDCQLGVPVTAPERTIRDLRRRMSPAALRRMISDASYAGLVDPDAGVRLLGPARRRERDAVHAEHGRLVVRITWERLRDTPQREAQRLRRILAARSHTDRAQ